MDRRAIMVAAWDIFRQAYGYPTVPFKSIGRQCFAWALKEAHRRARVAAQHAAHRAAMSEANRRARIASLQFERELTPYVESFRQAEAERARIDRELALLAA